MGVLWPPEGEIWLLVTTGGEFGPESELLFEASTAKTKAPESVINIRITWKKWNKMNNLIRIAITETKSWEKIHNICDKLRHHCWLSLKSWSDQKQKYFFTYEIDLA